MLVCDRCSRAAAASRSTLKRGETRKLTETDLPEDMGVVLYSALLCRRWAGAVNRFRDPRQCVIE